MDQDLENLLWEISVFQNLLWEISVFLGGQSKAEIVDGEMIGNEAMKLNQRLGEWLE